MTRKYKVHLVLMVLFTLANVIACRRGKDTPEPTPNEFDRTILLKSIADNIILDVHEKFVTESGILVTMVGELNTSVDTVKIKAAQEQWRKTANAWKACELFNLGTVRDLYVHTRVHTWPANTDFINGFINSADTINETYIASKGSSSKGLAAIEYLLFNENGEQAVADSLTNSTRKVQYLYALSQNLAAVATEINNIWVVSGTNYYTDFISAGGTGVRSSTNMLVNEMLGLIEKMANTKLGKPMGKDANNTINITLAEAYRSRGSLAMLQSNLSVLKNTFHGGTDASSKGFDDYLDAIGAKYDDKTLSAEIDGQFTKVENAFNDLSPSLEVSLQTQPAKVETAYVELKKLLVLFKVDLISNLSITLTLNDNDGD